MKAKPSWASNISPTRMKMRTAAGRLSRVAPPQRHHRLERRLTARPFTRAGVEAFGLLLLLFGVGLGCNSPAGKNHYILAERLFSDHKYAAAVDEFTKLVD